MTPRARYGLAWLAFLVVTVVLVYGMEKAGVPFWLRNVVSFAMGWTCAKPLRLLLLEHRKGKR